MVAFGCSLCFKKFLVTDHCYNFKPWLRAEKTKNIQSIVYKNV